jgi:ornithine cyclodeaminase/alanine dehydrogenase-like protein (mu-crystallin family)
MTADLLYLSRQDLVALGLQMPDVIEIVRAAILQQNAGGVVMPSKASLAWKDGGRLNGNAAFISQPPSLGIKWNAEVPANVAAGLPNLTALVLLNDPVTGFPTAVLDGTWITAMRTGAASAITASHLAPSRVRELALIGCGVQMRTQLLGLLAVLDPAIIRIYDLKPEAAEAFKNQMQVRTGKQITVAASAEAAVRGADVVVSATKFQITPDPTLKGEWLKPGCLLMPIDVATTWEAAAFLPADKFVTDRWSILQSVAEAGHFPHGMPPLYAELHEIVAGSKPGRENDNEFIVSMNEGMPIEDMALGQFAVDRAKAAGIGTRLPFIGDVSELYDF